MDFEIFKKAVDSLEGFVGTIGVMGGEPTLHPEFEKIATYIGSKYPQLKGTDRQMLHPQAEFMKAIQDLEFSNTCGYDSGIGKRQTVIGPGLFSAMGKSYQRHYEIIQDTFKYQALNDHNNPMYHQPILVTRKELGITDNEWIILRDNCWIQNEWSATITPKGAFFCEVAGMLDLLFDGPGGWKIEPGWWKRTPDEFGEQLHWCELCGLACHTFMRNANEEIDDVSPVLYHKLEKQGSPYLKSGHVNLLKIENGQIAEGSAVKGKRFGRTMPYTENFEARFHSTKSVLYPQGFDAIYHLDSFATEYDIQKLLDSVKNQFENVYIVCQDTKTMELTQKVLGDNSCVIFNAEVEAYKEILKEILQQCSYENYLVFFAGEMYPKINFADNLKKYIFNPGVLIYSKVGEKTEFLDKWWDYGMKIQNCKLIIMNCLASSLKNFEKWDIRSMEDLVNCWNKEKTLHFNKDLFYSPPETLIRENKKYAIYGNGVQAQRIYDHIKKKNSELVCIVDSNRNKQNNDFNGYKVQKPEFLKEHMVEIDYVIIGSVYYYAEIKNSILKLGFTETQIAFV